MRSFVLFLSFLFFSGIYCHAQDLCDVAREVAKKSLTIYQTDKKKGLSGLIQAYKMCKKDFKIAYDLGVAYYRYKRPDLAYKIWKELAKTYPKNFALLSNLCWTAAELGKLDEAKAFLEKAIKIKKDPDLLDLKIDIMFKKGEYEKALVFAMQNQLHKKANKAGEYLAETTWNRFRSGEKEEALKELIELCKKYRNIKPLQDAKEKMVLALVDESEIPLPKPLPDQIFKEATLSAKLGAISDETLDLRDIRRTLNPTDKAYALIVGIRRYKYIKGPRFADNDAWKIYRLLVKRAGFMDDQSHIRFRLNQDATLGTLLSDIEWLVKKAKLNPDAKIFFYFSGHGSPVVEGNRIKDGLLVPYEAQVDALNERTAIPLSYIKERFSSLKNRYVVAVLDACFSGTGKSVSGMKLIRPKMDVKLLASNKLFISAASADKPAKEYKPGRQGAFTYFFIKALLGDGDKNKDGWVDTLEAFEYARQKLFALDFDQNPQISVRERIKLTRVR